MAPTEGLVLLVGAAGSGKTWWRLRHYVASCVVSSDEIRYLLTGDMASQAENPAVFRVVAEIVAARMRHSLLTVVDATNARADHRAELTAFALEYGRPTAAVVFLPVLDVCRSRQEDREQPTVKAPNGRAVPPDAVERMHRQITADLAARPGLTSEVDLVLRVLPDGQMAVV